MKLIIDNKQYNVWLKGVFIYNNRSGIDAVKNFVKAFIAGENCIDIVRGNFAIQILDKAQELFYSFTDNSGVGRLYYTKNLISSSFLNLVSGFKKKELRVNRSRLVEFLRLGYVHNGNTFFDEILLLNKNQYLVTKKSGEVVVKEKNTPLIETKIESDFEDEISKIINGLNVENVSIDLTGGIDSRLILAYFKKCKRKFETAISGVQGNRDITIANKIANYIGVKNHVTFHHVKDLNEELFIDIFELTDAQLDVVGFHRNYQLCNDRKSRNVGLQISGVGGELFKDYWWLQDFPRYNKRVSNIAKLYDMRIEGIKFPHHILSDELQELSINFRNSVLDSYSSFEKATNTNTYDKIYYDYKMRGVASAYLSATANSFDVYAPLLELDLVRIGYQLPRMKRFFNNFHRNHIAKIDTKLAAYRTTEGMSNSASFLAKIIDLLYYGVNKSSRMIKVLVRKVFKTTILQESPNNPKLYSEIKRSAWIDEYDLILKKEKVLAQKQELNKIPDIYFGRLFTIAMLLKKTQ